MYMHLCESEREIGCMCAGGLFADGFRVDCLRARGWIGYMCAGGMANFTGMVLALRF
jgi:hypothetical protein